MLFQLLHHDFDGFLELRVVALAEGCGIEVNFDIGRDTVILHFPLAVEAIDGSARRGDPAAINQFGISPDADQSSPCLFADKQTNAGFAEIPGQGIAAGA